MSILHAHPFAQTVTENIKNEIEEGLRHQNYFVLSLSGGNTPRPVYEHLAKIGKGIAWNRVILIFGDERCVSPESDESNYRMARESLIDQISIPAENVYRIKGEREPRDTARDYEEVLISIKERTSRTDQLIDLCLLGLGDDGHTASLFPDTTALREDERTVVENFVPKFDAYRITLTFPVINDSQKIFFLLNDEKKENVLRKVLKGDPEYPARLINQEKATWFLGWNFRK